jgi:hypothetical protein
MIKNIDIFSKVVHKLAVDSALFLLKFHTTIRLLYNQYIELSRGSREFKQKYRCIYCKSVNHLLFFPLIGSKRSSLRIAIAA